MSKVMLLVEDNDADAELVEMALSQCGSRNRLDVVKDGEEAVNYLLHRGEHSGAPRPHLVILDWNLPRLNGMEVLETIRGVIELKSIPFVIFSGGRFTSATERFLEDNLAFQLNKPVTADEFFEAVRRMDEYVTKTAVIPPADDSDLLPLRRLTLAS